MSSHVALPGKRVAWLGSCFAHSTCTRRVHSTVHGVEGRDPDRGREEAGRHYGANNDITMPSHTHTHTHHAYRTLHDGKPMKRSMSSTSSRSPTSARAPRPTPPRDDAWRSLAVVRLNTYRRHVHHHLPATQPRFITSHCSASRMAFHHAPPPTARRAAPPRRRAPRSRPSRCPSCRARGPCTCVGYVTVTVGLR